MTAGVLWCVAPLRDSDSADLAAARARAAAAACRFRSNLFDRLIIERVARGTIWVSGGASFSWQLVEEHRGGHVQSVGAAVRRLFVISVVVPNGLSASLYALSGIAMTGIIKSRVDLTTASSIINACSSGL